MYEEDRENREDRDQEIERTEIMDDVDEQEDAAAGGFFMKRSWSVFLISEKKRLMRTGLNG